VLLAERVRDQRRHEREDATAVQPLL